MSVVLQDWVACLPWKQQSILLSGMRGPDAANVPAIKAVNRWMRTVSQHNADPSKDYMKPAPLPDVLDVCAELEFLAVHYVHHFADALAVIAYGGPVGETAGYAARLHYTIAEELFHFRPEDPNTFWIRHRDKPDGVDVDADLWVHMADTDYNDYILRAFAR